MLHLIATKSMWIPPKPFGDQFSTPGFYLSFGKNFPQQLLSSVSVSPIHLGCVFWLLQNELRFEMPIFLGDSVLYCWYTFIFPGCFISRLLALNQGAYSAPDWLLNIYPEVCKIPVVGVNLHPHVCWSFLLNWSIPKKGTTVLLSSPSSNPHYFQKGSQYQNHQTLMNHSWTIDEPLMNHWWTIDEPLMNPKTKRKGQRNPSPPVGPGPHLQRHGGVALDELSGTRLPLPGHGFRWILCSKTWLEWILIKIYLSHGCIMYNLHSGDIIY